MRKKLLAVFSVKGVPAETLAVSAALALLLGVFPVYGCPTLLCAAAAFLLRLNLPAMQAVNLLTSPLQLALLAPFGRLGARLVHMPNPSAFGSGLWQVAMHVAAALVHAVTGWCCIAAPLGIVVYLALRPAVRGIGRIRLQTA